MKRERQHDDLIDLGAASIETRGSSFGHDDTRNGLVQPAGLNNE